MAHLLRSSITCHACRQQSSEFSHLNVFLVFFQVEASGKRLNSAQYFTLVIRFQRSLNAVIGPRHVFIFGYFLTLVLSKSGKC